MKRTFSVTLEIDTDIPLDPDSDRGPVVVDVGAEHLYDRLNGLFEYALRGAHVSHVREVSPDPSPDTALDALRISETTLSSTLALRGYREGECTDSWHQMVKDEVRALSVVRTAIAKAEGRP